MQLSGLRYHRHQAEAVEALDRYYAEAFEEGTAANGLLVMPTGSGKTFTAASWLLDRAVARGYKVIWLAHRQELIEQADYAFRTQAPLLSSHGKTRLRLLPVSGGHYSMSMAAGYDIYLCCIASAASRDGMRYIKRMLGDSGKEKLVVVIDEAHHAVSPSYQKVLKRITEINPHRLILGLTATPTRMEEHKKVKLFRMFDVYDRGYIYEVSLKELLADGFLARPVYKRVETKVKGEVEFNISAQDELYFSKHGELSEKIKRQLAKSSFRNEVIVNEYLRNRDKYGKTLIFAVNKAHAITLKKAFKDRDKNISCDYCISGEVAAQEKIRKFKKGEIDILINVQIMTEGSDVPDIKTVFLTRQTSSDSLLMQMIGRGLRGEAAGGTKFAYIIDFHDTWGRFSFWLDPKELLRNEFDEFMEEAEEEVEEDSQPKEPKEGYDQWDLTLRMYSAMRAEAVGLSGDEIFPHGWYSVRTRDGQTPKVLVFDNQLEGYRNMESSLDEILNEKPDAQSVIKHYFASEANKPKTEEVQLILDALYYSQEMPEYFTFAERDILDAKNIARELIGKDLKRSEEEDYLKQKYEETPVIREVYKEFAMFKGSVLQAALQLTGGQLAAEIITIDERQEFNIKENHHDLERLLKEVVEEAKANEWFEVDIVPQIRWTNRPVRSKFGVCTENEEGSPVISINKLLCSEEVKPETIKYLIYNELLRTSDCEGHNERLSRLKWRYPNSEEHEGFLSELFSRYRVDELVPGRRVS